MNGLQFSQNMEARVRSFVSETMSGAEHLPPQWQAMVRTVVECAYRHGYLDGAASVCDATEETISGVSTPTTDTNIQ